MPAAGTCNIVNYVRERLRRPFQSQSFSALGRHQCYCELREGSFQSQKGQKILPAAGSYGIVNQETLKERTVRDDHIYYVVNLPFSHFDQLFFHQPTRAEK